MASPSEVKATLPSSVDAGRSGGFARPGRWRRHAGLRMLRRETSLSASHLVQPYFVTSEASAAGPIGTMPGVSRLTLDGLESAAEQAFAAGVPAVLLFGLPEAKDGAGSSAYAADGVVPRAVKRLKANVPDLAVMTDVCLCQSTEHGQCGVLDSGGDFDLDATLSALARTALVHAHAGADVVAPSAMIDGMVAAIRRTLDGAGADGAAILAYSVKYASAFYGPFRDAARSAPSSGHRRHHQMDPANALEALAEVRADVDEGADAVMVKPALAYLDVIRRVADDLPQTPLFAYQVSGEYASIMAAAEHGILDRRDAALETLVAIRRAGASAVITYFATSAATWLTEGH